MIVIAVKYSVKSGLRDELLKIVEDNVVNTRKEKGNIEYSHYPSLENDTDMFVFEVWETYEDVNAHIHADHYLKFSEKRKPMLIEGSYEYTIYDAKVLEEGKKIKTW